MTNHQEPPPGLEHEKVPRFTLVARFFRVALRWQFHIGRFNLFWQPHHSDDHYDWQLHFRWDRRSAVEVADITAVKVEQIPAAPAPIYQKTTRGESSGSPPVR
jgi:hypothetical protein